MDSILILGGTNFIGPAVVRALQARGFAVTLLNRGRRPVRGVGQLIADRNDEIQLRSALADSEHFDAVVDLSCYTERHACIALGAVGGRARLWIFLSTAAVYDQDDAHPCTEDDPAGGGRVWGGYGRDKAAAERVVRDAKAPSTRVILRPPYVYGPGNSADREAFVWRRAMAGCPVLIPADWAGLMQFVHVDDLARAIQSVIEIAPAGVNCFNVGGAASMNAAAFVRRTASAADLHDPSVVVPRHLWSATMFPFGDHHCQVNADRVTAMTGWTPRVDFDDGMRCAFEWYQARGGHARSDARE